jgi:hypothetical protein
MHQPWLHPLPREAAAAMLGAVQAGRASKRPSRGAPGAFAVARKGRRSIADSGNRAADSSFTPYFSAMKKAPVELNHFLEEVETSNS